MNALLRAQHHLLHAWRIHFSKRMTMSFIDAADVVYTSATLLKVKYSPTSAAFIEGHNLESSSGIVTIH